MYEKYGRRVYAFAMRLSGRRPDAEDLLSETMMRTFLAISQGRAPGEDQDAFTWLCTICANAYRDSRRRAWTRERHQQHIRERYGPEGATRSAVMELSEQELGVCWKEVLVHIETLPAPSGACLLLKVSGYSYDEIAETLKVDRSQVKNAIESAMRQLRQRFLQPGEKGEP